MQQHEKTSLRYVFFRLYSNDELLDSNILQQSRPHGLGTCWGISGADGCLGRIQIDHVFFAESCLLVGHPHHLSGAKVKHKKSPHISVQGD